MKAMNKKIKLLITFYIASTCLLLAQENGLIKYVKRIENVQTINIPFLIPEINMLKISDTLFFKKYEKSLKISHKSLKNNNLEFVFNFEMILIHKSFDTVLSSKNKIWNKNIFKKLKRLTPLPTDTLFSINKIKPFLNYQTDETNVEDLLLFSIFMFQPEKSLEVLEKNEIGSKKIKNWEESFYPFSSCDYVNRIEILSRMKVYLKKFSNTKSVRLKKIIIGISNQKIDC